MDIAQIGLQAAFDSVDRAKISLDDFSNSSKKAESAAEGFSSATKNAGAAAKAAAAMLEGSGKSAAAAAAGIEKMAAAERAAAKAVDDLRAKYVPLYAAQRNHAAAIQDITRLNQLGHLSATEMALAIDREKVSFASSVSAINQQTEALRRNRNASAQGGGADSATAARRQNAGYQLQDIGVSLYSGMPVTTVMIQQGAQLLGIYGGAGGLNAAMKDFTAILGAVVRYAGPVVAVGAALYGAYRLLDSYSAAAAVSVSEATAALAAQAAPLATVEGKIAELANLQKTYEDSITATGTAQNAASAIIIANTEAEFNAKKSLLELELKRQNAAIATQEAEMAIAGLQLKREVGQSVFTRADLERQGFADPRIGQFVRLPDEISGIAKTQEILDKSPINDRLKEMQANLTLTRIATGKLGEALKSTFNDGSLLAPKTPFDPMTPNGIPVPGQRPSDIAIQDEIWERSQKGAKGAAARATRDANAYRDLIKTADDRIAQLKVEATLMGSTSAASEALRFATDLLAQATDKGRNIDEKQIAIIKQKADEYGRLKSAIAAASLEQDLLFERQQMFRSSTEQRVYGELKSAGIDINSAEGGAVAKQIRLNEALATGRDLARDFAGSFVHDLANGASAVDALTGAVSKLADKLIDMALDSLINNLFSNLTNGGGGGLFGGGGLSPAASASVASGGVGLYANGGVFSRGRVHAFAAGGVVSSPTTFAMAGGVGLMGEAGPEAIMPLRRGRDGKLGVVANNNQPTASNSNVHVTVGVSVDQSGNLQAYVKEVAQNEGRQQAVAAVQANNEYQENRYQNGSAR